MMNRYDFFIGDKYDPSKHDLMTVSPRGRYVLYSDVEKMEAEHKDTIEAQHRDYDRLWSKYQEKHREIATLESQLAESKENFEIVSRTAGLEAEEIAVLKEKLEATKLPCYCCQDPEQCQPGCMCYSKEKQDG